MGNSNVFISYRRATGLEIARNLSDRLRAEGFDTFFDYSSMRDGKFNDQIFDAIDKAEDFIIVLSPGSLDRCISEGDWVRTEIEYAISKGKHIVPFACEDFVFPQTLPESFEQAGIRYLNFVKLNQDYYDNSIERLISALGARSNKIRGPKFRVIALAIAAVILLSALAFILFAPRKPAETIKGCEAMVYLMRYSDLSLICPGAFNEESLGRFQYEDSISSTRQYFVYPVVDRIPDEICDPIFRARVVSRQRTTVVFCSAELEIKDYVARPDLCLPEVGDQLLPSDTTCRATVPVHDIVELVPGNLTYPLDYTHSLVSGEVDEDFWFALRASESCQFEMRMVFESTFGEYLASEWIDVICVPSPMPSPLPVIDN